MTDNHHSPESAGNFQIEASVLGSENGRESKAALLFWI